MASEVATLKLLIDTKSRKVLFAEAGKEFVDFLFSLLSLPVGTIIKLLSKKSMVGSIGNLYQSIESLSDTYIQPNLNKDSVLNPKTLTSSVDVQLLLPPSDDLFNTMKFYQCPTHPTEVGDDSRAMCSSCKAPMTREVKYVPFRLIPSSGEKRKSSTSDGEGGIVKGVVTYMVMDDLVVSPMSTISSITMLNKLNVKEVGALEERVVTLGINQGLQLLKASLQTKAVLTSVFLGA